MVTLKSVFADVDFVDGYYSFLAFNDNPEPCDIDLKEIDTRREFANTLEMMDFLSPKVAKYILDNHNDVKDITFNVGFHCNLTGYNQISDQIKALQSLYTKI